MGQWDWRDWDTWDIPSLSMGRWDCRIGTEKDTRDIPRTVLLSMEQWDWKDSGTELSQGTRGISLGQSLVHGTVGLEDWDMRDIPRTVLLSMGCTGPNSKFPISML